MTHQSKYHENKRLIRAYARYLDHCETIDDKIKLSGEIGRLSAQNKAIGQMTFEEAKKQLHCYTLEVPAILPKLGEFENILPDGRQLTVNQ